MKPKSGYVWITRRKWDAYFLAAVLLSCPVGALSWWSTSNPRMLAAPLLFLSAWAITR